MSRIRRSTEPIVPDRLHFVQLCSDRM
jgi:hypothetical protein